MSNTSTAADRAAAIGTVVLSLIDAVAAALALLPLGFAIVYFSAWSAALHTPGLLSDQWPIPALLLALVWALLCAVLWALGAILVSRRRAGGRRLVVAGSVVATTGLIVAWAWPGQDWGGFDALMYTAFSAAPMVFALLPGTRRWCTEG